VVEPAVELPRTSAAMSPEEKRELLLRYLERGERGPDARSAVDGLDFSETDLSRVELIGANLAGVKLPRSDLTRVNLTSACLDGADLSNTRLAKAILVGASMRDTQLVGAWMERAELGGAHLMRTNLRYATIDKAEFTETYLRGARLEGTDGTPYDRRATHIDAETYRRSGWSPAHLTEWLRAGAITESFADFPADAQLAVFREFEGLVVFLSTRLLPWDQTVLHAFVCSILGLDTDVRIAEYTENPSGESCRLRLVGSNIDDLVRVAEHITRVSWRAEQKSTSHALALLEVDQVRASLDHIRAHVEKLELWERQRRNSEGATEDAKLVLARSWGADLLRAGMDHLLDAVGVKKLANAGADAVERAAAVIAEAKGSRDVEKWEAEVARQELEKDDQ